MLVLPGILTILWHSSVWPKVVIRTEAQGDSDTLWLWYCNLWQIICDCIVTGRITPVNRFSFMKRESFYAHWFIWLFIDHEVMILTWAWLIEISEWMALLTSSQAEKRLLMSNRRSESTRAEKQRGQQGMFWAVLVRETAAENVRTVTQLEERCRCAWEAASTYCGLGTTL